MSTENKIAASANLGAAADAAAKLAAESAAGPDIMSYTHTFQEPFSYNGHTVTELAFDWGALTGEDHQAIEDEMLRRGQTLVVPAFTGAYLAGMAVRACTNRDDNGIRIVDADFLKKLPIRDYQKIYMSARRFLLRSES